MHASVKNPILLALVLAPLFLIGVFTLFYPPYLAAGDEHSYLTNAALLTHGSVVQPTNEYYCALTQKSADGYFSTYPLGKSIELIPFLGLGVAGIFWLGMIVHLLNYILFIFILRKLNLNPLWGLLYLFFPAFQWETRTLYPELSVLTFFLGAFWLWLSPGKRSAFLAGFLNGLAMWVRTDAFLGILAFSGQAFFKERDRLIPFLAGAFLPVAGLIFFNLNTFGSILPQAGGASSLLGMNFGPNLIVEFFTFLGLLFIVLPFSLLALRKQSFHRPFFIILTIFSCLFFVRFFSFWALPVSLPLTLTARLRYFIPLLGMLMIPAIIMYSDWLSILKKKIAERVSSHGQKKIIGIGLLAILVLGLVGATLFMHSYHASFQDSRKVVLDAVHETIPLGAHVIGSADDCVYFLPDFFGEKKYTKVTEWGTSLLDPSVYLMDISYATQRDTGSDRQDVVDAERKKIKDFIELHKGQLEKVFESKENTWITIWKVKSA